MTRRIFIAGSMAGVCATRRPLVLEAIAAERMPQRLVVPAVSPSAFFELRDYGAGAVRLAGVLNRHGIRPVLEHRGRLLFPFETLAARERAWRLVSADPQWIALRDSVVLGELAVYRRLDRGPIGDEHRI